MKRLLKAENLNASYEGEKTGFNDLEFKLENGDMAILRNARVHLDIDFENVQEGSSDFEKWESYWDDNKNIEKAIEEAEEEDIYEV